MKWLFATILIALVTVAAYMTVTNLKDGPVVVEVSYALMACENCMHMDVINSSEKKYVNEIIIPESKSIDIRTLVDEMVQEKKNVCLLGRPYKYNPNLLGIEPDGIRFEVKEIISATDCAREMKTSH